MSTEFSRVSAILILLASVFMSEVLILVSPRYSKTAKVSLVVLIISFISLLIVCMRC